MKTINREAMKTRILTTALMIILTLGVFAEPNSIKNADTLSAPHLALISGTTSSETIEYTTGLEYLPVVATMENSAQLAEWIDSRENWEQFDAESPVISASVANVSLDNWLNDRTSWEQASSSYDLAVVAYFNNVEDWYNARESWEQSVSGSDLARQFEGKVQPEWMNARESWEQK